MMISIKILCENKGYFYNKKIVNKLIRNHETLENKAFFFVKIVYIS